MSENMERLRKAIAVERQLAEDDSEWCGCDSCTAPLRDTDVHLAAVEQELAELRTFRDNNTAYCAALEAEVATVDRAEALLYAAGFGLNDVALDVVVGDVLRALAELRKERDELRKDAGRWRELRTHSGLSVTEDGQVDLFATVADSTEVEDASWLTETERRALDGELETEPTDGMRNGWVWKADALDRAVDALVVDAEKAAQSVSDEADPATAAGEG